MLRHPYLWPLGDPHGAGMVMSLFPRWRNWGMDDKWCTQPNAGMRIPCPAAMRGKRPRKPGPHSNASGRNSSYLLLRARSLATPKVGNTTISISQRRELRHKRAREFCLTFFKKRILTPTAERATALTLSSTRPDLPLAVPSTDSPDGKCQKSSEDAPNGNNGKDLALHPHFLPTTETRKALPLAGGTDTIYVAML